MESRPRRRYLLAAALLVFVTVLALLDLAAQTEDLRRHSAVIRASNYERMLTYRIGNLARSRVRERQTGERLRSAAKLTATTRMLEGVQVALSGGGRKRLWLPDSVRRIDFDPPYLLDARTRAFTTLARAVTAGTLPQLSLRQNELISIDDLATDAYAVENERSRSRLLWSEAIAFAIVLLTLALEVIFIFRPMERDVYRKHRVALEEIARAEQARAAFAESEERLQLFVAQMPAILWAVDAELTFTYSKGAGLAAVGRTPDEAVGRSARDYFTAQGNTLALERLERALHGESISSESTLDGRKYRSQMHPRRDADGRISGVICVALDVTEFTEAAAALEHGKAALARTERLAQVGSWSLDLKTGTMDWSDELYRLCGLAASDEAPTPATLRRFVHPDDRGAVNAALRTAYRSGEAYSVDRRILKDGAVRWVQQQGFFDYEDGVPVRLFGMVFDVTERKLAEERLAFSAYHDELTRLPNRAALIARVNDMLKSAHGRTFGVAILVFNVDRFRAVTNAFGPAVGEEFILAVTARISRCVPKGSTVARIDSDEFAIALDRAEDGTSTIATTGALFAAFGVPFKIGEIELATSISIGTSRSPGDATDAEELLQNADAAMFGAKRAGRGFVRAYSAAVRTSQLERMTLDCELRQAYEREELHLNYQPIVTASGRMIGVEALLRWNHSERGPAAPDHFIPIAEESGLIVPIGAWVLDRACTDLHALHGRGFPLRLAVNISSRQLENPDFASTVQEVLQRTGFDPRFLELEITESAIMVDVDAVRALLLQFRAMGVHISIDDFGTGYSSLAYLKRLPVDTLKIDQSFVRDLEPHRLDGAIAHAIVTLAHSLKLRVIAEGVETESQFAYLGELRCDEMQGYFFSRPTSLGDIEVLLQRGGILVRPSQVVPLPAHSFERFSAALPTIAS